MRKRTTTKVFTRTKAVGIIMRRFPNYSAAITIAKADALYVKRTGNSSNIAETKAKHRNIMNFMEGYTIPEPEMTIPEALGLIMKDNPEGTQDLVLELTTELLMSQIGLKTTTKQLVKYYKYSINFLKGYTK